MLEVFIKCLMVLDYLIIFKCEIPRKCLDIVCAIYWGLLQHEQMVRPFVEGVHWTIFFGLFCGAT